MTLKSIANKINIPLLLISFTYLAMWIVGLIGFVLSQLVSSLNIPYVIADYFILTLFYMLSMILPMIGILLYMDDIRPVSKRWYLAIPLLISAFLLTYVRDNLYMTSIFGVSFMSANGSLPFLETQIGQGLVSILFSISSILLVLSMPDIRRKVLRIPFALSIVMTISFSIYVIVTQVIRAYYSDVQIFGILHIICILLFGLFLSWFAVFEEELLSQFPDAKRK